MLFAYIVRILLVPWLAHFLWSVKGMLEAKEARKALEAEEGQPLTRREILTCLELMRTYEDDDPMARFIDWLKEDDAAMQDILDQ